MDYPPSPLFHQQLQAQALPYTHSALAHPAVLPSSVAMVNQAKRQVLMIAPTSFFSDYGGHIRILEETLALQQLGNQVTIVTYYKGKDVPGLDIRRTRPVPYRTNYEVGSSRHKIAFDVLLSYKALKTALQIRPDIIHGHMHEGALIGGVIAKLLRIPLVFDFQGSLTGEMVDHGFLKPGRWVYRAVRRVEQTINHLPQAILTSSQQAQTGLQTDFAIPADRLIPLPDCVDLARFDPHQFTAEQKTALRQALNIPDGRSVIAYLGLLTDYQGIPHILHSALWLKQAGFPCHFLIMGFPNVPHYQGMAEGLGVADVVSFPGRIPYESAPLALSLGDIAISAKMSTTEGSGKLLNYMALGLPVVAYDTPVHREYLGEWGSYAPAGDFTALAQAIHHLLTNPTHAHHLGQQLRHRVQTVFSWRQAAQRIDQLYANLIHTSGG